MIEFILGAGLVGSLFFYALVTSILEEHERQKNDHEQD